MESDFDAPAADDRKPGERPGTLRLTLIGLRSMWDERDDRYCIGRVAPMKRDQVDDVRAYRAKEATLFLAEGPEQQAAIRLALAWEQPR